MAAKTRRREKTQTPGVYKLGNRYVAHWRDRAGGQHSTSCRTYAEAREEKARRSQPENRTTTKRERFDTFARAWIAAYQGRRRTGFDDASRRGYRDALEKHVLPRLGHLRINEIERRDIKDLVAHLQRTGKAPNTIRGILAPVRACLADAAEDGDIPSNPAAGIRINDNRSDAERLEAQRPKAMTPKELALVLGEIPEDSRLLFEVLVGTGLRISEALGLEWGDFDLGERPVLHVHRQHREGRTKLLKTANARRDIPLSPKLAHRLRLAHLVDDPGPSSLVFRNQAGKHLSRSNLMNRVLKPAAKRAGVPWIGFHTFRHTYASLLFQGGANVKQVSRWLGHSKASFTLDVYVHLMGNDLGSADFIDRLIEKGFESLSDAAETDEEARAAS